MQQMSTVRVNRVCIAHPFYTYTCRRVFVYNFLRSYKICKKYNPYTNKLTTVVLSLLVIDYRGFTYGDLVDNVIGGKGVL